MQGHGDTLEDVSVPEGAVIAVLLTETQVTDVSHGHKNRDWVCSLSTTAGQYSDLWEQDKTWTVTLNLAMTATVTIYVDAPNEETARSEACEIVEQDTYISCGEGEVTDEDVVGDVVECISQED